MFETRIYLVEPRNFKRSIAIIKRENRTQIQYFVSFRQFGKEELPYKTAHLY